MTQSYNLLLQCGHNVVFTTHELPDDYNLDHDPEFVVPCVYCQDERLVVLCTVYATDAEQVTSFQVSPQ